MARYVSQKQYTRSDYCYFISELCRPDYLVTIVVHSSDSLDKFWQVFNIFEKEWRGTVLETFLIQLIHDNCCSVYELL